MDTLSALNHVAFLKHRAESAGATLILKLPKFRLAEPTEEWTDITVAELAADVEAVAHFLAAQLRINGILPRSVVSVWLVFFFF